MFVWSSVSPNMAGKTVKYVQLLQMYECGALHRCEHFCPRVVRVCTGVILLKPVWEMRAGGSFDEKTVIVSHEMSVKSLGNIKYSCHLWRLAVMHEKWICPLWQKQQRHWVIQPVNWRTNSKHYFTGAKERNTIWGKSSCPFFMC